MSNVDIARALKDKNYFNSLSEEQKATVRKANPAGESKLDDSELDSVSGGLGGGEETEATTTTTAGSCSCPVTPPGGGGGETLPVLEAEGSCACNC